METRLPCHPEHLPKMVDKTILTLPITVSVAMPTEKVGFWQSSVAFGLFFGLVVSTFLLWLIFLIASHFYSSVALAKDAKVVFYTFIAMLLLVIGVSVESRNKSFSKPNFLLAKKTKWKTIPIMTIESQKIVLTDYFPLEKKIFIFDAINKFYLHLSGRGASTSAFLVDFKDKTLNTGFSKSHLYAIPNEYMIVNSHRIYLRELLNLMNTAKKANSNQITFLSMDSDDNLMDIGL